MVKITILALALALPLSAGFVGPEIPLSTPVIEPAPGLREQPAVASNGNEFLVVWRDTPFSLLRAARVDGNGVVRDREPLTIGHARGSFDLRAASVASDGRDYVIAYACSDVYRPATCLAHVAADSGLVTARGELPNATNAAIASNGSSYLVAYMTPQRALEAVPLLTDGSPADAPYSVATTTFPPALASNGEEYFLVFGTREVLSGVLLSEKGFRAERQRLSEGSPLGGYRVASDDDGFLVTWQERLTATSWELRAAPVSSEGVAGASKAILAAAPAEHALAWNGSRYVVTYSTSESDANVLSFEVSATGGVASEPVPIAASARRETDSAVASNEQVTLAVWLNQWGPAAEIEARLISRTALGRPFVVSLGVPAQDSVAAMRTPTHTVVAWDENSGPDQLRKVYVQRLDANGAPLDGRGVPAGNSPRHQLRPALAGAVLAWVEVDPLADWSVPTQVWATELDFTGKPVGRPVQLGIAAQNSRVAVANPGGVLQYILWQSPDNRIMAARFAAVFAIGYDPAPFAISSGPLDKDPVVSSNGDGFVVAWNREQRAGWGCVVPCFYPSTIRAAAFTKWGEPLGTDVEIAPVQSSRPVLLWNGAEHVVFWTFKPIGEAFAQKLARTGTPIGAPRSLGRPWFWIDAGVWSGDEYRLAVQGAGGMKIVSLDRDFNLLASVPTLARQAADDVVLFDDLVIYLAPHRGTDWISSRVVARRLGENASPPRRRATRPR